MKEYYGKLCRESPVIVRVERRGKWLVENVEEEKEATEHLLQREFRRFAKKKRVIEIETRTELEDSVVDEASTGENCRRNTKMESHRGPEVTQ